MTTNLTVSAIETKIFTLRGVQVMIDRDLAELYGVETRVLNQAVKRNMERFPEHFMFEADASDIEAMMSQSVIPSKQHLGGAKPFIFSEQGIFYNGQIFDAYTFVSDLIRQAKQYLALMAYCVFGLPRFARSDGFGFARSDVIASSNLEEENL